MGMSLEAAKSRIEKENIQFLSWQFCMDNSRHVTFQIHGRAHIKGDADKKIRMLIY
jgi:hypothetical protein